MSLPLQVVLTAADGRQVNASADLLGGVRFGASIPGGYTTCAFSLPRSLRQTWGELAPLVPVRVVDESSAELVWSGRNEVPARTAAGDGESIAVTAVGAWSHTSDTARPIIFRDQRQTVWKDSSSNRHLDAIISTEDNGGSGAPVDSTMYAFRRGAVLATGDCAPHRYYGFLESLQRVARVSASVWFGNSADGANLKWEIIGRPGGRIDGSPFAIVKNVEATTTAAQAILVTETDLAGQVFPIVEARLRWAGGAFTVSTDSRLARVLDLVVWGNRFNADGTAAVVGPDFTSYSVVKDLLGRLLPLFDGANATLAVSTTAIDQMAYEDGVTAAEVFDDLALLEPGYFPAAWEIDATSGKARFEWTAYPTRVQFDVDSSGGFGSPGSSLDLYNEVEVRWVDGRGVPRSKLVTGSSPILTAAGVSRRARLDLGSEIGSATAAATAGAAFLTEHAAPSNNGQVVIDKPVMDRVAGRLVQPWEIPSRLGRGLIRVRDVVPRVDALNATDRDAVSIFRAVEAQYDSDSNSCVVTLDSFTWRLERQIARLRRRQARQPRP